MPGSGVDVVGRRSVSIVERVAVAVVVVVALPSDRRKVTKK
jgi:hypothetical protein